MNIYAHHRPRNESKPYCDSEWIPDVFHASYHYLNNRTRSAGAHTQRRIFRLLRCDLESPHRGLAWGLLVFCRVGLVINYINDISDINNIDNIVNVSVLI